MYYYWYVANFIGDINKLTASPTAVLTPTPSETPSPTKRPSVTPSPTSIPEDQSTKIVNVDLLDLAIKVNGIRLLTSDEADVVAYLAGTAVSGEINGESVNGYDYYVFGGSIDYQGSFNSGEMLRNKSNGEFLLLSHYRMTTPDELRENVKWVDEAVRVRRSEPDVLAWFGWYGEDEVTSQSNRKYAHPQIKPYLFDAVTTFVKVDSFYKTREYNIYRDNRNDSNGAMYLRSSEGLVVSVDYIPDIVKNSSDSMVVPDVVWDLSGVNTLEYTYRASGACTGTVLDIVDVNASQLTQTGRGGDGSLVYELIDTNDAYLRKLFNEDYLGAEMYKYNKIATDDAVAFTYEQYLAYHPVFFWRDPFSRLIRFVSTDFMMVGGCAKPAIYLYPATPQNISVRVIPNGRLTFTAPRYDGEWNVMAQPNGLLKATDGNSYPYLWWESQAEDFALPRRGFVVPTNEIETKLSGWLTNFGLNAQEQTDYLSYWLPILKGLPSPYIWVSFLFDEQVDLIAMLQINPTPDKMMRLFMLYKPLDVYTNVDPLPISPHVRDGFTVVEWGGGRVE